MQKAGTGLGVHVPDPRVPVPAFCILLRSFVVSVAEHAMLCYSAEPRDCEVRCGT